MNVLSLLDEVQAIARTGLAFSEDPYDRERYERLLALAVAAYTDTVGIAEADVRARLGRDLGYVTAKVGADGAIVDEAGRLLLVRRADDGCWGLVSGWVDPGESPDQTVVREIYEEVGLTARVEHLVGAFGRPASVEYGPHGTVAIVYLCSVEPGPIACSHEVTEARYRAVDEVDRWHKNHEDYARSALRLHRDRTR